LTVNSYILGLELIVAVYKTTIIDSKSCPPMASLDFLAIDKTKRSALGAA
jgi:hypothetical protein